MNTILLATDYSPAAQNAATYAANLALHLNASLEMVHAYTIPFAYTDAPVPLLNIEEIQRIAEESMASERVRIRQLFPELHCTTKILPGDIIDCLSERIEEHSPLLVVMGTSGNNADSFLWGSMAVKALRQLKGPVLAIPVQAAWEPVQRICFAADYEQVSAQTPCEEVLRWSRQMNAALDIVHVDKPGAHTPPPTLLLEALHPLNPAFHSLAADHLEAAVASFLRERKVDWLLIIPRKYGFFESLFHKSRTKLLATVSNVPVLALHQE